MDRLDRTEQELVAEDQLSRHHADTFHAQGGVDMPHRVAEFGGYLGTGLADVDLGILDSEVRPDECITGITGPARGPLIRPLRAGTHLP